MNNIKFSHEGVEYEVDLGLAINKGLVKKVRTPIESVTDGDVFIHPRIGISCVYFYLNNKYFIIYRDRSFSSFNSEKELVDSLNQRKLELVGNKLNIWKSIFE